MTTISAFHRVLIDVSAKTWRLCVVWVWCGDKEKCGDSYQHCWLKHVPWPYGVRPQEGPKVPWTSGILTAPPTAPSTTQSSPELSYHVVTSAQGSSTMWQIRVHYYWCAHSSYLTSDSCDMAKWFSGSCHTLVNLHRLLAWQTCTASTITAAIIFIPQLSAVLESAHLCILLKHMCDP